MAGCQEEQTPIKASSPWSVWSTMVISPVTVERNLTYRRVTINRFMPLMKNIYSFMGG